MSRRRKVAVDAIEMRNRNASLLLQLIWREREISRAELARRTGLSPSTVSAIIAELDGDGLVRERGTGASRGGRRPTLLGFCDDAYFLVGVEIGASHVTAVITNLRGEVIAAQARAHTTRTDPGGTLALGARLVETALAASRVRRDGMVGIGVAVPSPVDPAAPGQLSPLILPAWRGIDIGTAFEERFGRPVRVENDANAGALAEHWWGAGQDGQDLAYIKVATGIGAGHIIDGRLYRGSGGTAGEIGHMAIDPHGPECVCGLRGCLTTFIGTDALLERARGRIVPEAGAAGELTVEGLVKAARSGQSEALALIDELGNYLGIAVANLLNLINPGIVVLGGGITAVGDLLVDPLRATLRKRALFSSIATTRIVTSRLGEYAIAVGATASVLDAALHDRTLFPTRAAQGAA